jgi:DNA helicase II / ATP-dependent DNA helicase PcrA
MKDNKKQLNKEQLEAVEHTSGPLLIVAGAGTGKTTVITEKVAYLVNEKKIKADEILALTFTDKAAGEMEERIDKILPYGYTDLWIMTFHAFCERILKAHGLDIGIANDFKLLNSTEQWMLVRENLDKFNLDYYRPLGNPTKFIHALVNHFSRCKDEEISPEDYLEYADKLKIDLDTMESTGGEDATSEVKRLQEISNAYHIYQQLLLDNSSLDFGDLINYTLKLFRKRPNILKKYQDQFKYVLVDEFQDTNWAQYELVKLLVGDDKNLTVVGDDDQCLPGDAQIDLPTGKKKIKDIVVGDEVLTAVGKGHLGVQKVNKVFRKKKKATLLTIKLKSGNVVSVTDNHKMFCYTTKQRGKGFVYVYLMYKQGFGWRMGITNDLIVRLRLERSADSILAVRGFDSEEEARYYETLWSLTYGIPTVCFKEREGLMIKGKWIDKLYQDIDVESNVRRFAKDMNIDLSSYHHCLEAVTRGGGKRIKINITMCYRKYRSKDHVKSGREFMQNSCIIHQLSLETSNKKIIDKLKKNGFKLGKTKKGLRLSLTHSDIKKVGEIAKKLQEITGGFIESKFNLGRINYQHWPALIMPAKNLVKGGFLPIRKKNQVIYDQIVDIKVKKINQTVYDLEIDRTHNFIANGVIVHNSVYKFRGASVSNILQFKDDFSKSKEIYLNQNYRSSQNILDLAYNFIQLNNPERLEVKLNEQKKNNKLSKKLESNILEQGIIEHLHYSTAQEEVEGVIDKVIELSKEKEFSFNDVAILVRANNQAEAFLNGLRNASIPFNFVASKGLYSKEIIMDVLAYLKLLDNYHESLAMWRVLNFPMMNIKVEDLMEISRFSQRKTISLYEACQKINLLNNLEQETVRKVNKIMGLISAHTKLTREKNTKAVVLQFLQDFNYSKWLLDKDDEKSFVYINLFVKKMDEFEGSFDDKSVKNFMRLTELELESGEQGSLSKELEEGPESVKVMTIHSAKGLEFKYVFVVNLVDKRFPSMNRQNPIILPNELIKEVIPSGDVHLQEERRLFYVAMTRAKLGLYLTSAQNYGGTRKKKLSRFIYEVGLDAEPEAEKKDSTEQKQEFNIQTVDVKDSKVQVPTSFSYSQLKGYETCPYQYYLGFILKIPVTGKAVFSYGKTMHSALQKFFASIKESGDVRQDDLFNKKDKDKKELPSEKELMEMYMGSWIDDWYESKEQKQEYKKQGEKSLKNLYQQVKENTPKVIELEKGFNFKIKDYSIRGVIDRVDHVGNNKVEIVDYKTGRAKTEKTVEKDQLLMYQMAAKETFNWDIDKLTFYYLDNNTQVSFLGTDEEIDKQKEKMLERIKQIRSADFNATPSKFKCQYCDFKNICQFKEI